MKKITLIAAFAVATLAASAQYQVEPGAQQVIDKKGPFVVDAIVLDDATIKSFNDAGFTVRDFRVNDEARFLYVWDGTFTAGDSSFPGVDFQVEGYPSLVVGTVGWSGAGFFAQAAANWDMSNYNENSRLHIAYRGNNLPASLAFIFLDETGFNKPAKFSVGTAAFDDNGTIYPLVAGYGEGGDWAGLDISFADLKKFWPGFEWSGTKAYDGNTLCLLAGGVTGKDVSLDAIYVYTPVEAGVASIDAENAPAVYFNILGQRVENPTSGLYICRQGNKATKVLVK